MTRTTLSIPILLFGIGTVSAQMPPTCMLIDAGFFASSWGGVTETADGGAAFTGGYDPTNAGYSDVVVTKLDASGALQWMKIYSTGAIPAEWGRDIIATADGGTAVAGYLEAGQIFIMKLDANGDPQWTKSYDAPGVFGLQSAGGLVQLADGGFATVCTSQFLPNAAWFMLRTDANGEVLWSDRLDYVGDYPMDVAALPNGDLILINNETGLGMPSPILRKDGLTGATEWLRWYTTGPDNFLAMQGVVTTADSTIVVAGYFAGIYELDAFAFALSSDGTPLWTTRIGTEEIEYASNIAIAPNGDYLMAGDRHRDTTNFPELGRFVVRLDPNGQPIWSKNVGHPDANHGIPVCCAAASDGGVLVTGYAGTGTNYPQSFIKLDANGNSCPYCPSVDVGVQDTLVITPAADQSSAWLGPWATAADLTFIVADITADVSSAVCTATGLEEPTTMPQVTVAPNPFTAQTIITCDAPLHRASIELRDVSGRLVRGERVEGSSTVIDRRSLATGLYIYRIVDDGRVVAHGSVQVADR